MRSQNHRCLHPLVSLCGAILITGSVSSEWVAAQTTPKPPDQERLAEAEDADRLFERATAYAKGSGGVQKDEREAVRLYRLAADRGSSKAQSALAFFYEQGLGGLDKDENEAARRYRLAADQGDARGQHNLAVYYENGRGGLTKNPGEAARLYRLAAEQGDAHAQYALGYAYQNGRDGLKADESEA